MTFDILNWLEKNCHSDGELEWGCPTCHYWTPPTKEEEAMVNHACKYGHCRIGDMERDGKIYG